MEKKWLFLLFAILVLGLTACDLEVGDNYVNFAAEPAVVAIDNETVSICVFDNKLLAPGLDTQKYKHGDCLLASYRIYTQKYTLEASDIEVKQVVEQMPVEMSDESIKIDEYNYPIKNSEAIGISPLFEGKVFFQIHVSVKNNTNLSYRMTLVHTPKALAKNEFDAYLMAKLNADGSGLNESRFDYQVFDFKLPILSDGIDESDNGWMFRTVKVNLYYFTEFTDKETPKWVFSKTYLFKLFNSD